MNANVEDRGIKGDCTPLMEAASAGHVDIVRLLIAHNADVNAQSSSGKSPFGVYCMWFMLLACFTRKMI
jgi:ankyrin repeat domain-containing protein 17